MHRKNKKIVDLLTEKSVQTAKYMANASNNPLHLGLSPGPLKLVDKTSAIKKTWNY